MGIFVPAKGEGGAMCMWNSFIWKIERSWEVNECLYPVSGSGLQVNEIPEETPISKKEGKTTYCSNLSVSSGSNTTFTRCVRSPIDPSIWALGFRSSL